MLESISNLAQVCCLEQWETEMTIEYSSFFKMIAQQNPPREWQSQFASEASCQNRFIPIGTGLGKTMGLAGTWFYRRVVEGREDWPRRLVWCLPMRVLVEQTLDEFQKICEAFRNNFTDKSIHQRIPSVHAFLGGIEPGAEIGGAASVQWYLQPENNAMIVGTQDMLLSRALGRGYAAGRARWPIDFGMLNSDCLWVFDEVQLMGVSAITGSQLQCFREWGKIEEPTKLLRPSYSWWSSATLRPRWLETVDSVDVIEAATGKSASVPDPDKQIPTYAAIKPLTLSQISSKLKEAAKPIAEVAIKLHGEPGLRGACVTLVVLNKVDTAVEVAKQIGKLLPKDSPIDVRLIHSRFRGKERERWRSSEGDGGFLTKGACQAESTNRIIVSTQVIEAGVDISAGSADENRGGLVTELAPWSSLVQRFGRAARYGGTGRVVVLDRQLTGKDAAPYDEAQLTAAREALTRVADGGLSSLAAFDQTLKNDPALDEALFKLEYNHLLSRNEFDELFDNSLDVTGDDIDISRFIREDDETNAYVCWIETDVDSENLKWRPPNKFMPTRTNICPAPFLAVRDWLFDAKKTEGFRKLRVPYAFVWDYENGRWIGVRRNEDISPGSTVLVDFRIGGYDVEAGFTGESSTKPVAEPVALSEVMKCAVSANEHANRSQSSDSLSITDVEFQSIADHGREVGDLAEQLAREIGFEDNVTRICRLAGYWHDWGKSHPVFQANIIRRSQERKNSRDIAKAPKNAWLHFAHRFFNCPELSLPELYKELPHGRRSGFRHELASVLGIFELLARADSRLPALRGNDTTLDELFDQPKFDRAPDEEIVADFKKLSPAEFNLFAYLIAAHHGKVRCQLLMTEHDQKFRSPPTSPISPAPLSTAMSSGGLLPIRGVRTGDVLPATEIFINGKNRQVPSVTLHTSLAAMGWNERYGASWSERAIQALADRGPFDLSLLEAILRAADVRCSQSPGADSAYAQVDEATNSESNSADTNELESDDLAENALETTELEVLQ